VEAIGIEGLVWQIFNRWGLMVFSTDKLQDSWDGKINGKQSPEGVYSYKIILFLPFGDIKEQTGIFTLVR
jgi:gliding motility-associated-like protein